MVNTHLVLLVSLILLVISHSIHADTRLPLISGGVIIDESTDQNLLNRRIVTGEVKRVRTEYEPESMLNVVGTMTSTTLQLGKQRGTEEVIRFYQSALEKTAEILFQCQGLDCGSSNYWANALFHKALLYGPGRHQFYLVAKTQTGAYQVVYVAQRGTGAVYAHLVRIAPGLTEAITSMTEDNKPSDIATQMRIVGQYQLQNPVTSQEFAPLVAYLTEQSGPGLALVIHNVRSAGETIGDALARSHIAAETLKQKLHAKGLHEPNISVYAVGPLAPDIKGPRNRTALVRVD